MYYENNINKEEIKFDVKLNDMDPGFSEEESIGKHD